MLVKESLVPTGIGGGGGVNSNAPHNKQALRKQIGTYTAKQTTPISVDRTP